MSIMGTAEFKQKEKDRRNRPQEKWDAQRPYSGFSMRHISFCCEKSGEKCHRTLWDI